MFLTGVTLVATLLALFTIKLGLDSAGQYDQLVYNFGNYAALTQASVEYKIASWMAIIPAILCQFWLAGKLLRILTVKFQYQSGEPGSLRVLKPLWLFQPQTPHPR
ncbi:hypothetical protein RQP46_002785 [Phenoliferia psychrophenolica]